MRYLLALLVVLMSHMSFAAPYSEWWQKANTFYKQKQYDSAIYYYEQIAAMHPADAEVYYNLGNTYYRLNRLGPAVLNYERALHIDPSYREAEDNLALTQSRIGNRIQPMQDIFFVRWWKSWAGADKAGLWAVASLALFLAIIGLLIGKRLGKIQNLPPQILGIGGFIWAVTILLAIVSARQKNDSAQAVVMQSDAPLLSNPQQAKAQVLVPEGTTVCLKETKDGWVEVELPDGRSGWMQRSLLEKI